MKETIKSKESLQKICDYYGHMLIFAKYLTEMARKHCKKIVASSPGCTWYKPAGVPLRYLDEVVLRVEEYESLRLADYQGLYHLDAGTQMGVSRQTFGRLVTGARRKIAEALVTGKAIRIEGGNYSDLFNQIQKTYENSSSNQK